MIAVNTAPDQYTYDRVLKLMRKFLKDSLSRSGSSAPDMMPSP